MRRTERFIGALLSQFGYPFLLLSAVGVHLFTVFTAYGLAAPGGWRFAVAAAALALPLVSEGITAYYAWRASGSWVNAYSIWLLLWLLLFFVVLGLISIQNRLARR